MFQALPQRHTNRPHAPAPPRSYATLGTSGDSPQVCTGALPSNGSLQQPYVALSSEACDNAQAAVDEMDCSLTQGIGGKPHDQHAFRLSFSPTGIPNVDATQPVNTQASSVESTQQLGTQASTLESTQQMGTQASTSESTQQLGTQAYTVESPQQVGTQATAYESTQSFSAQASTLEFTQQMGAQGLQSTQHLSTQTAHQTGCPPSSSATNSHTCQPTGKPQSSGSTAVPAAIPKPATCNPAPAGSTCLASTASAEIPLAAGKVEAEQTPSEAGVDSLLQLPPQNSAPAPEFSPLPQAASASAEFKAQVAVELLVTGAPAQDKTPVPAEADACSTQSDAVSEAQSGPLLADALNVQAELAPAAAAQASIPIPADAEGTPSGPLLPVLPPPPTTPVLAWLAALRTPESQALSLATPGHEGAIGTAAARHVPLGSTARAWVNESTPELLAASPEAASEALWRDSPSPTPGTMACTELLPQSSSTLLPPPSTVSGMAVSPALTHPGPVPDQPTPGPVPDQAMPGPVPHQATPMLAGSTWESLQATPRGWAPRQPTPSLGPPTGLSGLTTPASAAEMHRCVSATCVLLTSVKHLSVCTCYNTGAYKFVGHVYWKGMDTVVYHVSGLVCICISSGALDCTRGVHCTPSSCL